MKNKCEVVLMSTSMLATIIYASHVVLGGIFWKGYNQLQQPISDLTASGASDRMLMQYFATIYGFLALVFAVSFTILEGKKHHKLVFLGGMSFIVLHLISISYGLVPQDLPGHDVHSRV